MSVRAALAVGILPFFATACLVPEKATPSVAVSTELASKFVHRGMTNVDKAVLQPRLAVALPTVTDDRLSLVAWGNLDLHNDTGNAWFPDGQASRFSQIDFIADYQRRLNDTFTVRGGIHNYNLPNGLEFLNGERGATTEVFAQISANVLEATPYFAWNYDFDEVRGAYYRAGITESFDLGKGFTIVLDGSLGYASSAQAAWLYGIDTAGFADLRGRAQLNYQYDARTQLTASVNGSYIVDDTIRDWFPQIAANGVDPDPIWFTIGVGWTF